MGESDRPLTHTDQTLPAEAMRLAVKSVTWPRGSDCIASVRERPIGISDSHGLTDLRGRVRERPCA